MGSRFIPAYVRYEDGLPVLALGFLVLLGYLALILGPLGLILPSANKRIVWLTWFCHLGLAMWGWYVCADIRFVVGHFMVDCDGCDTNQAHGMLGVTCRRTKTNVRHSSTNDESPRGLPEVIRRMFDERHPGVYPG